MKPQLIKTILEVQCQIPVNMTSDFDTVAPFLASAETSYIVRMIGSEQIAAIKAVYDSVEETPDDMLQAIDLVQKVVANLGYALAIPILSLSIGSSGIQIVTNENTKQAFQWQVNDLKNALYNLGFSGLEDLLMFLESKPGVFTEYAASAEYQKQKQLLINTAVDFDNYYQIRESRLIFQSIAYLVRRVEDQTIAKLIGVDFLASLKQAGLSDKKQTLVDKYLKPGIALLTIAKALMERVISLDNGEVTYNFRGNTENMKQSQAATNQQISNSFDQLMDDGNLFLQDGLQFIADNPDDMEGFSPPVPRRRFKIKNDPCNGIFGT